MAAPSYIETFDESPGDWVRVVDNLHPPAPLPVKAGALWSYGPWWVDYIHAPPGAGYLQLLMCLPTKGPYTEQSLTLVPEESKWSCLGARHDRVDYYGRAPLTRILSDVNVNLYLLLFPVRPRPMGPIGGDPHRLRAGKDYPVWPSSIAQGYVAVDTFGIDWS